MWLDGAIRVDCRHRAIRADGARKIAAVTEWHAPNTVRGPVGQARIRQQTEGIQHHVNVCFFKRANQRGVPEIDDTTTGERGLQADRDKSVRIAAKQGTIYPLVQREEHVAQCPPLGTGREQRQHDGRDLGFLNCVQARVQPVGNRSAICDE